jgi:PAS domain S-box-containing protein
MGYSSADSVQSGTDAVVDRLLTAMMDIADLRIRAEGDLDRVLTTITQSIVWTLDCDRAAIWQLDREAGLFRCLNRWFGREQYGDAGATAAAHVTVNTDGMMVSELEHSLAINDTSVRTPESGSFPSLLAEFGVAAQITAPAFLGDTGRAHVVASMETGPRDWTDSEITAIRMFANVTASLLEAEEARRANAALLESEQRFRDFAETAASWHWEMDENLRISSISERHFEVTRIPNSEVVGKSRRELLAEGAITEGLASEADWQRHLEALERHEPIRDFRHSRRLPGGGVAHMSFSGKPVFDEHGNFRGYRCTTRDITGEVEARADAEQAQGLFAAALNQTPLMVTYWDDQDRLVHSNDASFMANTALVIGETFEAMLRRAVALRAVPDAVGREEEWVQERLARHRNPTGPFRAHRFGRWMDVYEYRLDNGGSLIFRIDVTQQVEQEQELRRSQKLQAMGGLVGGLSHELNNLLQPLLGLTQLALESPSDQKLVQQSLEGIYETVANANEVLQRMLGFAGRGKDDVQPRDLNEAFAEIAAVLRTLVHGRAKLRVEAGPDIGEARISISELMQVAVNLVKNAADAIPEGGEVRVALKRTGAVARLSVEDDGPGVPAQDRERIMDPYFTTKDVGEGIGLGLSIVHRIVDDWGGQIRVMDSPSGGARFEVTIPLL